MDAKTVFGYGYGKVYGHANGYGYGREYGYGYGADTDTDTDTHMSQWWLQRRSIPHCHVAKFNGTLQWPACTKP